MPVIRVVPQDPTDYVLQGGQLLLQPDAYRWESNWSPLINDPPDRLPLTPTTLIAGSQNFGMVDVAAMPVGPRASDQAVEKGIRSNACISTPCGAIIPVLLGHQWFWNDIGQTTVRFAVTGVTKDSAGAALGNCRVVGLETGRIETSGAPVVGETISDGSGNYTLPVPMNTAYQCMAYKPGSPDVAGITRADVTPGAL